MFWAVHDARQAVAIDLHDEFYHSWLQVPDPAATIELLQGTLAPVTAEAVGLHVPKNRSPASPRPGTM